MSTAKPGDTVRVHYTGSFEDGAVFDSSRGGEPLEFTIGAGEVIAGFEHAVIGMQPGESKRQTIPPEEGYGAHERDLEIELERSRFPAGAPLEVGRAFRLETTGGEQMDVRVTRLSDATVTLDGNHPLAGRTLDFEIELLEIVAA